jgi:plastocyanin
MLKVIWTAVMIVVMGGAACKGSPSDPSPAPGGVTITIANNAVNPKNVTVSPGSQVTFMNSDTRPHNMVSDPHPEHTDCPEINQVAVLAPGQSRQTGNLNTVRACGFHDHDLDSVAGLKGTITIR